MTTAHARKLLTVITETALEKDLCADLEKLGAQGYTVTDARGKGHTGTREASWDASGNIRVEVVCTEETAHAIADHLKERYYANYAMILYLSDVQVLRPGKF
jgi:nitrogen regulatory protein PII